MANLENPEKVIIVTEPVLLRVVGSKQLQDEIAKELEEEDPDEEKAEAILKDPNNVSESE